MPERDFLIQRWKKATEALEAAKTAELDLRQQVINAAFHMPPDSGTVTQALGNGWQLKAVFKQTYKLDKETVHDALDALEQTPEGKFVAERLVTFDPRLSVAEYKKLAPEHRRIIDAVLTISPAQASLTLVEPKASSRPLCGGVD